ncbi:hypothetical protein C8R46DRAFT_1195685 [Mycena filopes]|nr:hypothetical protein C8R46DRAFT_1195685 [Mycena filopes]
MSRFPRHWHALTRRRPAEVETNFGRVLVFRRAIVGRDSTRAVRVKLAAVRVEVASVRGNNASRQTRAIPVVIVVILGQTLPVLWAALCPARIPTPDSRSATGQPTARTFKLACPRSFWLIGDLTPLGWSGVSQDIVNQIWRRSDVLIKTCAPVVSGWWPTLFPRAFLRQFWLDSGLWGLYLLLLCWGMYYNATVPRNPSKYYAILGKNHSTLFWVTLGQDVDGGSPNAPPTLGLGLYIEYAYPNGVELILEPFFIALISSVASFPEPPIFVVSDSRTLFGESLDAEAILRLSVCANTHH